MKVQKLIFTFLTLVAFNYSGFSAFSSTKSTVKNDSIENTDLSQKEQSMVAQMKFYASKTAVEYAKYRGKKLNFFEKISFKFSLRRMKSMLESYSYGDGPTTLQKISFFVKGLLLGPLALILGYLFLEDEERELIKWIWFGFIGFAAIAAIVLLM